jgi:hypothetical protein
MTWTPARFEVATERGKEKVSGWTSPAGLGLHIGAGNIDDLGRHRWHVTHLKSGIAFLFLNVAELEMAIELVGLVAETADWNKYKSLHDLIAADPEWALRLLGIKHALGDDWMELPDPAMNDPGNVAWLHPDMTKQ